VRRARGPGAGRCDVPAHQPRNGELLILFIELLILFIELLILFIELLILFIELLI
jgi:hypothetical protein